MPSLNKDYEKGWGHRVRPGAFAGGADNVIRSDQIGSVDSASTGSTASSNPFRVSANETTAQVRRGFIRLEEPLDGTTINIFGTLFTPFVNVFVRESGGSPVGVQAEYITSPELNLDDVTWANQGDLTYLGSHSLLNVHVPLTSGAEDVNYSGCAGTDNLSAVPAGTFVFGFRFKWSDETPSADTAPPAENYDMQIPAPQAKDAFFVTLQYE